ncbi:MULTISPECIES: hypothetical protein [unclassified Burkholderia]|uniref:hypothetical protein n=1 Tax=unclassified Burkholderia TaxID=2613784 RepID=UPI000B7AE72A|nr:MULTISPECIES: hypothetical protein [unclassified Burkholderia]MCA8063799.1 hypothetical protein [Burkholderia sp. AU38729]OXI18680.1 hypothetical protein CFB43_29440 [Burkholderia sp. AU15512]
MVVLGRRPAQGDIARMIRFGTTLQFVTVLPHSRADAAAVALKYLLSNTHATADFTFVGNPLMKR